MNKVIFPDYVVEKCKHEQLFDLLYSMNKVIFPDYVVEKCKHEQLFDLLYSIGFVYHNGVWLYKDYELNFYFNHSKKSYNIEIYHYYRLEIILKGCVITDNVSLTKKIKDIFKYELRKIKIDKLLNK